MKKGLVFTVFLLMGVILGHVLTQIANQVTVLEFLTWGKNISIAEEAPLVLDLAILKLVFGMSIQMNLAIVICVVGTLLFYSKVGKNI